MNIKLLLILFSVLIAFAANSVLSRLALHPDQQTLIDPSTFVFIRLISGAVFLSIFLFFKNASKQQDVSSFTAVSLLKTLAKPSALHCRGAIYLFIYAAAFSFAYIALDTGMGALILFGTVQLSIILLSVYSGKRLHAIEWLGCGLAILGLLVLTLPTLGSVSDTAMTNAVMNVQISADGSVLLMVASGVAWGLFTLNGMESREPIYDMTMCFILSVPLSLLLLVYHLVQHYTAQYSSPIDLNLVGVLYAVLSGAIASGLGYALWYSVLPSLTTAQAGSSQLLVPIIAAVAGSVFLMEPLTLSFLVATLCTLGGIALVIWQGNRNA